MKLRIMAAALALAVMLIWACGESTAQTAKATLVNTQGQKVGEATLTETAQGVKIDLRVENLPPGVHAFHIHEKGDCHRPGFRKRRRPFQPLRQAPWLEESPGPPRR